MRRDMYSTYTMRNQPGPAYKGDPHNHEHNEINHDSDTWGVALRVYCVYSAWTCLQGLP